MVNAVCVGKDPTKIYYQSKKGVISQYCLELMKISKIFYKVHKNNIAYLLMTWDDK